MSSTQSVTTVSRIIDGGTQESSSVSMPQQSVVPYVNNNQAQTTWIGELYSIADKLIGKAVIAGGIVYYRDTITNSLEAVKLAIENNMYEFAMDISTLGTDLPNVHIHAPLTAMYWISKVFKMKLNPTLEKFLYNSKKSSRRFSVGIFTVTEQLRHASDEFMHLGQFYQQYSLKSLYEALITNTERKNVKELLQDLGYIKNNLIVSLTSNSTDSQMAHAIYDHVVQLETLAQCSTFEDFDNMFNATMHYSISANDVPRSLEKDAFFLISQLCCSRYSNSDVARNSCDILLQLILQDSRQGPSFLDFNVYTIGGKEISHEISTKMMEPRQLESKAEELLAQFTNLIWKIEPNRTWTAEAIRIASTFTQDATNDLVVTEVDELTDEENKDAKEISQQFLIENTSTPDELTGLAIDGVEDSEETELNGLVINIPTATKLELNVPTRRTDVVLDSYTRNDRCIDLTDFANRFLGVCHIDENTEHLNVTMTTVNQNDNTSTTNSFLMQQTNNVYPKMSAVMELGNIENKLMLTEDQREIMSQLIQIFDMKNINQTDESTLISSIMNEMMAVSVAFNRTLNRYDKRHKRNAALLKKYKINITSMMATMNGMNQTNHFMSSNITALQTQIEAKQIQIDNITKVYQRNLSLKDGSYNAMRLENQQKVDSLEWWLKACGWVILAMATVILFGLSWYFKCRKSTVKAPYIDPSTTKLVEVTDNSPETSPFIRPEDVESMNHAEKNEFAIKHDISSLLPQRNTYKRSIIVADILTKHLKMSEMDINKLNSFSKVYNSTLDSKQEVKEQKTHPDHIGDSSFLPYNLPPKSDNISHFSTLDRLKMQFSGLI